MVEPAAVFPSRAAARDREAAAAATAKAAKAKEESGEASPVVPGVSANPARDPSSLSLSVRTQEIQIYLALVGVLCMVVLSLLICLAWRRYGTLIQTIAEFNPAAR